MRPYDNTMLYLKTNGHQHKNKLRSPDLKIKKSVEALDRDVLDEKARRSKITWKRLNGLLDHVKIIRRPLCAYQFCLIMGEHYKTTPRHSINSPKGE